MPFGESQFQSEVARVLIERPWCDSPLGRPENWAPNLRTMLGVVLASPLPMYIVWGKERLFLYNDAYVPLIGPIRHPAALGQPFRFVWPEVWDEIGAMMESIDQGKTVYLEDHPLFLERKGFREEAFFTFSFSPIPGPTATDRGILCVCFETTERVLAAQALKKSEENLKFALASAHMGTWTVDLVTGEASLSPELCGIMGLPQACTSLSDLMEKSLHPEDFERLRVLWQTVIEKQIPYVTENRIIRPDGEVRWVYSRGRVATDKEGNPRVFHGITTDVTERRHTLRLIEENAGRFKQITEAIPAMVFTADVEGNVTYYNQRWFEYTGLSWEDAKGWGWQKTVHPNDLVSTSQEWKRALSYEQPLESEHRMRRASDGSYRWHLVRAVPIRSESGEVIEWFGTVTDLHNQRLLEAERIAHAERNTRLLNLMPTPFLSLDSEWRLTFVNPAGEQILALSEERVVGRTLWDALPGLFGSSFANAFERSMAQRMRTTLEDYYPAYDRWFEATSFPLDDGIGITWQDITERRRAQQMVEASELRYRTLAETVPQLVWTCKPDGQCDYLSQQWVEYTGVSMQDQLALNWIHLVIHPHDKERTLQHWMGAVRGLHPYDLEYRIRRKDGVYRWFKTRGTPVRNETGEIVYWFGTCTDIQDQRETRQQLEEAVRARDEFLSIASHELKTPLTSLKLNMQLFQRGLRKEDATFLTRTRVETMVNTTERQIGRLTRLVDDMLDITRMRFGKLRLELEEMEFCEFVTESVERMRSQFLAAGCGMPTLRLEGPILGKWDRLRMEQVLNNLLTNAIRYGEGNPVEVSLRPVENRVLLQVRDEGRGIAPEACEKIFDRFERAVDANEVSGLGLGLFISRQIVEAHLGRIWVESITGRGSTFYVDLPTEFSSA